MFRSRRAPVYERGDKVFAALGAALTGLLGVLAATTVDHGFSLGNAVLSYGSVVGITLLIGVPAALGFGGTILFPFMNWFMRRRVTLKRATTWSLLLTVISFALFFVYIGIGTLLHQSGFETDRYIRDILATRGATPLSWLKSSVAQWFAFIFTCVVGAGVLQKLIGPCRHRSDPNQFASDES